MESQLCAGEEVAVVGAGNSAGQAAVFLAQSARRAHLLIRSGGPAAPLSRYLNPRIEGHPALGRHVAPEIVGPRGDGRPGRGGGGANEGDGTGAAPEKAGGGRGRKKGRGGGASASRPAGGRPPVRRQPPQPPRLEARARERASGDRLRGARGAVAVLLSRRRVRR